jgi:hypothetical protein
MPFIAIWRLTLDGTAPWPWRLTAGHIRTLDDFLGYQFVSRRETADEYRERTGAMTVAVGVGPARHFLLRADFAEHDERLGASAEILVERDIAPTREEAVELVLPAVWEKTRSLLGDGDWNPSLSWLEVRELLGWRQPASGAKADEE